MDYIFDDYYIYNFRLNPCIIPDLICLNSRISRSSIILKWSDINKNYVDIKVFAINYNMLSISGLRYSS